MSNEVLISTCSRPNNRVEHFETNKVNERQRDNKELLKKKLNCIKDKWWIVIIHCTSVLTPFVNA